MMSKPGRSVVLLLFFFFVMAGCERHPDPKIESPRVLFPGLFEAVQSARIFPDSKTFPDCKPKKDPDDILRRFRRERIKPDFDLKKFVGQNFDLPEVAAADYHSNIKMGAEAHIEELWKVLLRHPDEDSRYTSLIALPFPYIVPGGRFREIYYWDSYFTMLGLQESGRVDIIENMVRNFGFLIRTYGFIPNGNRTYYLTRSQPPFFSLMVKLLMDCKGDRADSVLLANRDVLEKEHHFWMDHKGKSKDVTGHEVPLPGNFVLNRYYDRGNWPREEAYAEDVNTAERSGRNLQEVYRELRSGAESGWDFSSRWLADGQSLPTIRTTEIIPVDLNCLLFHLEEMLAQVYRLTGDQKAETYMKNLAEKRKNAIIRFCWSPADGWFKDYDWKHQRQTESFTLAGTFPLFFRVATPGQADRVAAMIQRRFLKPGGLLTSLIVTGQQWDAPNGWAPLQWIAISGLSNYGKKALASDIARRWSHLNIRVFNKTGKLLEKYNVTDTTLLGGGGEYPNQDGFGWTNGVLLKILKKNF